MRLFFRKPKRLKHLLLNVILMDPHTSATDLIPVKNDIISLRTYFSKFSFIQKRQIFFHRHSKRMMHGKISSLLITPLKLRELSDPYKAIFVFIQKFKLTRQLYAKGSQRIPHDFIFVSREQKQVARLSIHRFDKRVHLLFAHKLGKGRFHCAIFRDRNICKSFCTIIFYKCSQLVDLFSRHSPLAFCVDAAHASSIFNCTCEYAKTTASYHVCHVRKLHAKAQIRFIGTEAVHRFLPCHPLDRKWNFYIQHFFEQLRKVSFININHIIHIYERQLHVDLCKLRLSVRAQVFITETSCDLDVAVKPGAHQKLLVKLG